MLLLVRVNRSSGRGASGLLGCTGTALDFLVWMGSAISRSSLLFSSLRLNQPPNLANPPKTELTFSRAGWTAGMECRSWSQDNWTVPKQTADIKDLPHEPHANSINNGQTQWSRVLKLKGISILLVLIVSVGAISPQLYDSLIIPPRVRFTGVLLPNKDPSRKGLLDDLEVFIGNEKSTFVLDKMKIVGSVGLNRATLQSLFPPVIRFVGPDDLMRRLESPKIMGKVITIEGLLYTGSRMLFLTEVDDGGEAGTN